jgi:lipopolysaccharide transport system ATP-binding protein
MSDVAIQVEGVSKLYHIGKSKTYKTARETLMNALALPARLLRRREEDHSTDLWALRDVSFDVKRGEVIGIIGRNGAGKSTLLKVLSRITEPTSGRITLKGRVGSLLEVGTGFHPELSGRENIFLNGAILGMRRGEIGRKFDEIVDFSEVEKFIDTPVKHYSSGMYTRLAFAVAAHLEPEILIVDEVLAVGDAAFQKKCLGKMRDVAQHGRTVLFVSHNMTVIASLCERVVWLQRGGVVFNGPCRKGVNNYLIDHQKQAAQSVDLAGQQRAAIHGDRLKLTSLDWQGPWPLVHEGSVNVQLSFSALSELSDVTFGLGFSTPEGSRLLTYESDMYGPRVQIDAGENQSVTLVIPELPLPPGNYLVDVGVRSGDQFALDYLPGCTIVEVIPGARTPSNLGAHGAGAGVRLPSQWRVNHQS